MGQMTNILVKDDATTPGEYTLEPITDTPDPFWRASVPGTPIDGQIRFSVKHEVLKDGTHRVVMKTEVPVMETLGVYGASTGYVAPPKVAYVLTGITTFFFDRRSTVADRANTLKMHLGITQGSSQTTGTGTLGNAAAGDAFKNSVLPMPQFVTKLIRPS